MEGHWRRVAIAGLAVVAVAVVALVLAMSGSSRPAPGPGCIRAPIPGVMGGTELNLCGERARHACARHEGLSDPGSQSIEASCRDAGLLKPA